MTRERTLHIRLQNGLRRTLMLVSSYMKRASSKSESGARLQRAVAELQKLNGSTEREFLAIGARLDAFLKAARRISTEMGALGEPVVGDDVSQASTVLSYILDQSRQIQAGADTGDRALAGVCGATVEIGRTFRSFRDTVAVFRALASLTRIETARLGNAGAEFATLAEEVSALTESIESSGHNLLEASTTLRRNMHSSLATISGLRAAELKALPAIIADVTTSLRSLEERHSKVTQASALQAIEYQEVSAAIEDLITAIQFHDITRQQIEHVIEALGRICGEVTGARSDGGVPDIGGALLLQISQLSNAEQVLNSSVARIEQDMTTIADRVRAMTKAAKALIGSSGGEGDALFLEIEGRCTSILKAVDACATAEGNTQATLAELDQGVSRMGESVAQVREIENCVRRTAVNATIRAVHIGDTGNALSTLAEAMQRVTFDCNSATGSAEQALDTITEASLSLSGASRDAASRRSHTDALLAELRTTILKLHSSSECAFGRLNQTTALSAGLGEDILSARAAFSGPSVFSESIERVRRALEQIAEEYGAVNVLSERSLHPAPQLSDAS